ncbi:MAG: hypothetical protein KTR25_19240 [Myxococcales bacterium]|nr:hypothetical protein [Myxococcales bacterium]
MSPPLRTEAHVVAPSQGAPNEGLPTVGAPLTFVITARHVEPGVALLPVDLKWPKEWGERRTARVHKRTMDGDTEVDTYRLELVPFTSGILEIPSIQLALGSTTAATEPVLVDVSSNLSNEELQVASSTQPENLAVLENMTAHNPEAALLEVWDTRPGWGITGLVVVVLLGIIVQRMIMAYLARSRIPRPPAPPRPAHEVALEELQHLRERSLLSEGELNPYYTELSRIVRTYLGARYQFDAVERTLEELMAALSERETPGLHPAEIQSLLAEADLVKFTKFQPSFESAQAAVKTAQLIVEGSRPVVLHSASDESAPTVPTSSSEASPSNEGAQP